VIRDSKAKVFIASRITHHQAAQLLARGTETMDFGDKRIPIVLIYAPEVLYLNTMVKFMQKARDETERNVYRNDFLQFERKKVMRPLVLLCWEQQ
jgi:hypothetical protein